MNTVWDTLIVGGGPAGLVAAYELQRIGLRVLLLESKDRLGGRVHTARDGFSEGQYAEAGAEYFETEQLRVNHYINTFELEREEPRSGYDKAVFQGTLFSFWEPDKSQMPSRIGEQLPSHFFSYNLRQTFFHPLWEKLMEEYHQDEDEVWDALMALSVEDVLLDAGLSVEEMSYIRMMIVPDEGVELSQIPATQLEQSGWSDDYAKHMFRLKGGNSSLITAFAEQLDDRIWLGSPVVSIEQKEDCVAVFFERYGAQDCVYASTVVLATPTKSLQSIQFAPPLPKDKVQVIHDVQAAPVVKVLIQFQEQYWHTFDWNGFCATEHPLCVWNATEYQEGEQGILCFYATASMAEQLAQLQKDEATRLLLRSLQTHHLLPSELNEEDVFCSFFDWTQESFVGGGWSIYPLGSEEEYMDILHRPEGRIYFAGEHLPSRMSRESDEDLMNTVESALSSGIHAARSIVRRLQAEHIQQSAHSKSLKQEQVVEPVSIEQVEVVDALENEAFLNTLRKEYEDFLQQSKEQSSFADVQVEEEREEKETDRSEKKESVKESLGDRYAQLTSDVFEHIGSSKRKG